MTTDLERAARAAVNVYFEQNDVSDRVATMEALRAALDAPTPGPLGEEEDKFIRDVLPSAVVAAHVVQPLLFAHDYWRQRAQQEQIKVREMEARDKASYSQATVDYWRERAHRAEASNKDAIEQQAPRPGSYAESLALTVIRLEAAVRWALRRYPPGMSEEDWNSELRLRAGLDE